MILKGSQRGGDRQLAAHLLNAQDNDHVTLHELRGFIADDLRGALAEAHAVSKATQCKQFLFSLSLNPPKHAACHIDDLMDAVERAEQTLGLSRHPRAVVLHEKEGRRHAHVVWSRINSEEMKAVHLPFFKKRLNGLAKELYLAHGWDLPDGLRENGWKNPLNFSLAEWQQAKRIGLDPREIKQQFKDAWHYSDGLKAFKGALDDRGYFLARGDRRAFVAVDLHGEVHSVARLAGVKSKELAERLGNTDALPSVGDVRAAIAERASREMRSRLLELGRAQRSDSQDLVGQHRALVEAQRIERSRLQDLQKERWAEEARQRQSRIRRGIFGLWDMVTGTMSRAQSNNDKEVLESYRRDKEQCEALFEAQMRERSDFQEKIALMRFEHRQERMQVARHLARLFKSGKQTILNETALNRSAKIQAKEIEMAKDEFNKEAPPPVQLTAKEQLMAASTLKKMPPKRVIQRVNYSPHGTSLQNAKAVRRNVAQVPLVDMERRQTVRAKKVEFKRAQESTRSMTKPRDRD